MRMGLEGFDLYITHFFLHHAQLSIYKSDSEFELTQVYSILTDVYVMQT